MSFMKPEIIHDLFLTIETRDGDTVIPADVALSVQSEWYGTMEAETVKAPHGITYSEGCYDWEGLADALRSYLETSAPIESVTAKYAFGARLSAPGYMDCTEWSLFDSEAEAREHLTETYGDDSEEG